MARDLAALHVQLMIHIFDFPSDIDKYVLNSLKFNTNTLKIRSLNSQ